MRAPISIIIPTLNAGEELPETLACLGEGLKAGIIYELVVSDGGSEDATRQIAEEAGALIVNGAPGRGGQLRRGAAAAGADWLLVLHADTHLGPEWVAAVTAHMKLSPDRAGYFHLGFRAAGAAPTAVAVWANLRSRMLGLPYGDQGLLISRSLYDEAGGYADIPLMEDVALARALRGRLTRLAATAHTSAGRYQRRGWIHRGALNLITLIRYLSGADPRKLAEGYRRG